MTTDMTWIVLRTIPVAVAPKTVLGILFAAIYVGA